MLPKSKAETVVRMAKDAGFDPRIFTAVTQNGTFDIRLQSGKILSFPVGFLRKLRVPKDLPALVLSPEEPIGMTGITHLLGGKDDRIVTLDGNTVAVASCTAESSPFRQAVATIFAAVLPQILSGANLKNCRLAVGVEIPQDGSAAEFAVALALGLYRAEAELGVSASVVSLQASPSVSCPKLTVFSISESEQISSHFTLAGASIYLVNPQTQANGLPDFSDLRILAQKLAKPLGDGRIHAVGFAVSEPITEALCRMRANGLRECLTEPEGSLSSALPFAAILVSSEPLPFPCIGTVAEPAQLPES